MKRFYEIFLFPARIKKLLPEFRDPAIFPGPSFLTRPPDASPIKGLEKAGYFRYIRIRMVLLLPEKEPGALSQ
jgi:hypothetical protein